MAKDLQELVAANYSGTFVVDYHAHLGRTG